jgi:hypothetical protein
MIYDLGLSSLDEEILKKKKLTTAEKRSVRGHPNASVSLLNEVEFSDTVKHIILHHHEKYDGSGYPEGLKGEEIPFLSRVLHVVDTFCAMTIERPYREAMSQKEALKEMKQHAGSMYDPVVVDALEAVLASV